MAAASLGAPQGQLVVLPSEYPKVRRDEAAFEDIHGVRVEEPYRWLEDPDSEETKGWVDSENTLTNRILGQCETRDQFKTLMTRLYDFPRYGCPMKHGARYYYTFNTGLQAQSVLYSQPTLDAEPVVLIDPNKLSDDGTVALRSWSFSECGTLLAYSLSSGGSDWNTVEVLRIDQQTGAPEKLADELKHVKFSSLAWLHDSKGFFYHRYPPPAGAADLGTETDSNVDKQMWLHLVGRPQEEDVFLYAIPEEPTWGIGAHVTDDGRYLLIDVTFGCEPSNRVYYVDLDQLPKSADGTLDLAAYDRRKDKFQPLPVVKLVDNFDAEYGYVANEGSVFTFHTNLNSPRYRLVRVDLASAGSPDTWQDIIPEHERDLLQWATALKDDALVVCWLRDVHSVLELRSLKTGALVRDIPLPDIGSVSSFKGDRKSSEAFFSFTSFTDPGSDFRFDVSKPEEDPTLFRKTELKGGYSPAADFETQQVFVPSKDGTKVPMFIISRKGAVLDGNNLTLLYGYGGFNISLEPGFSVARLCWLLAYGGVVAIANLRGGGEYGIGWRNAGSLHKKQNVFDDFQACAAFLAEAGWTSASKLTIQGGSNGGLLVAACANQRPDLFSCVLAQVGVMDMLRFHKFTIGHAWISDYGCADKEEDFPVLYAYSPIHNVRVPEGGTRQYPAFLITTGDHDDRVVPLHSHKLTATLQHVLAGDPDAPQRNPLLTRIDVRAGHGAGKPTDKIIAEYADMFSYAAKVCGSTWAYKE